MNKKILLISIMLIVLCSLSAVSASEINGTDDSRGVDGDVLSAPSSVVSTGEINSSDVNVNSDSDVLSESSASTTTVSTWSDLKSACTNSLQYDTIYINGGITPPTNGGQISISKNLTIEGASGSYIGGSSSNNVRSLNYIPFFSNVAGIDITFKNLNFQNMKNNILFHLNGNGTYSFEYCTFNNIVSNGWKHSIIWLNYGVANITKCNFTDNTLSFGAITNFYSSNSLTVNNARMSINDCRFANNYGSYAPGVINNCGYIDIQNTIFENNRAANWAGAVLSYYHATTNINNSTFKNNKAGWNGGALYTYSILNVSNSVFENNNCTTSAGGGAIGAISSGGSIFNITIRNCNFTENRNNANGGYGGAISAMDNGYFHLYNSLFKNNYAVNGRAISVKQGTYYDNDTYNSTYENASLGHPIFAIANNIFVDSDISDKSAIAYIQEDPTYIIRSELNNTFYTSYSNLGSIQESNSLTNGLLGLSLDDVEIIGDSQDTPQWSMDGFNSSNSMESPYSGIVNGAIAWNYTLNNPINGFVIDKDGRVIVTNENENKVYYVNNNGTENRTIELRYPQSGWNNHINPINISISPDNNLYISNYVDFTYFQDWEKNTIIKFPTEYESDIYDVELYSSTDFFSKPGYYFPVFMEVENQLVTLYYTYIEGDYRMYVVLSDITFEPSEIEDINAQSSAIISGTDLWIPSSESLNSYVLKFTESTFGGGYYYFKESCTINGVNGRPSADANGNVYFFTSDSISKADATNGVTKTQAVTGGVGFRMAVSTKNNALYSVNTVGTLYKYSLDDLAEIELADIESTASTIMTDANGIIYVGSDDGKFYAFDDEGNQKWMVDTESNSAVKNCAMDNEGNIYFYTAENKVYAINEAPIALKNLTIEVTVPEGELTTVDNITITATLNETTEGNVTFTVGDLSETVAVDGNTASWTTKLPAGNQTITATFGGNDEFATATNTTDVEIYKADVEFENIPEENSVIYGSSYRIYFNIVSNGTEVKTGTIKGVDENGNEYTSNWRYYNNRGWRTNINNIDAGYHNITIVYSGDDNFNPANKTFTLKVMPKVSASVKDADGQITVDVNTTTDDATGKFSVVLGNETLVEGTIDQGVGSASFDMLEPGIYEFTIVYDGDDNYPGNNVTIRYKILDKGTSQWALPGFDNKNSGNPDYVRPENIYILWNATINSPSSFSSVVIDEKGNIYIADRDNVKIFGSNGTLIKTKDMGHSGALSLFEDYYLVYVRPWTNIEAFDIKNDLASVGTGDGQIQWYTNTRYAPILGDDGKIYLSVYYSNGGWPNMGMYVTMIEIDNFENQFVYDNVVIDSQPIASPVIDSEGLLWITTVNGLYAVDTSSFGVILHNPAIGTVGRPVIDDNNIVYVFGVNNTIVALNPESIVWNVTVENGIGTVMAIDNKNGFLYSVDQSGMIYRYYASTGDAYGFYDIDANATSIIVDGDGVVYVGDDKGTVWAFDENYMLLWNINLGSSITGQMAMDKNGVIYAFTNDALYALGYKNETTLDINTEDNYTVFDNITVTVNTNASGNISYELYLIETDEDNIYNSFIAGDVIAIDDGTATINLGNLAEGNYQLNVIYPDNQDYYVYAFNTTSFNVNKIETEITPEIDIEESTITLTFPENATGVVYVDVNGTGYYAEIKDNEAVFTIKGLEPGEEYFVNITYPGNENFTALNTNVTISVPQLLDPELELSVEDTIITVSINDTATGIVIVTVGDISFAFDSDDEIVLDASEYLENGTYDVTVEYLGDESFLAASANDTVTVPEEPVIEPKDPELKATAENTTVTVNVNKDATGGVIVDIDGTSYYAEIKDGQAIIDVKGLESGENYTATVIYTGDDNFTEDETTVKISVPKEEEIEPEDASMTVDSTNSTITVELPEDATGYVLVDIDGKGYYAKVTDGKTTVDVAGLDAGNYTATVTYTGDDNYKANTSSVAVSIPEEDEPIPEPVTPEMTVKVTNTTIEVTLPKDATGNVLVDVNGQGYYAPVKDGKATVNVIGLDEGNYPATVTYAGDDKYTNASKPASVTVPKDEEPTPEPVNPKADINVSDDAVNVELPKDATGYVLVDVDGKGYYAPVKDGKASIDLPELAPGNHTVTVTYTGDDKYKPATANKTVTVEKEIITVVSENLTKIEKAPDRFEAVFTDSDGNALANKDVTFGLNDITYTRTTDANGKAGMNINLVPGTYSIKTTNPVTNESVTNTITVLPRFTEDSDLVKYFRNDSQYVLKVLDDNGNPAKAGEIVTYNINGVFYNRTTNATGHVKLSINLPPKTYIITAEYKGCKVAHNVTVLPTLTGNDLTKKYGQSGAYEAKLVDGQGKAYANQKIEFNINGVMYQRTTDANGVAKLNINLQAGKYIITASYGQARISNTVTVTA